MKLCRIRLTNFRCYATLDLPLRQNAVFVGTNNSGKSAVLSAINKFWKSTNRKHAIVADDFHVSSEGERSNHLSIEVFFDHLSESATQEFSEYTASTKVAFVMRAECISDTDIRVRFHGIRQGLEEFRDAFELSKQTPIAAFNDVYADLAAQYDLPTGKDASSKDKKLLALRAYEANCGQELQEIESGDDAYGAIGPIPTIRRFFRFVYIPAVKDASEESSEANNAMSELVSYAARKKTNFDEKLSELETHVKNELVGMIDDQQDALKQIEDSLNDTLESVLMGTERTELQWAEADRGISIARPYAIAKVRSDQFLGNISSFGHGIQRTYLLSILKLVSEIDAEENEDKTSLMIGFEEPELYQHPPQVQMLCYYLQKLALKHQTLITTHSPKFIIPDNFEAVRRVMKVSGVSEVKSIRLIDFNVRMQEIFAKASSHLESTLSSLGTLLTHSVPEVFFSQTCVLVEGLEDVGYLTGLINLLGYREKFVSAGVNIIPVLGKNEIIPTYEICRAFDIPAFVIFDGDTNLLSDEKKWKPVEKTNMALFSQLNIDCENGEVHEILLRSNSCVWPHNFAQSMNDDFPGFADTLESHCEAVGARKKQARAVQSAINKYAAENVDDKGMIQSDGVMGKLLQAIYSFAKGGNDA